MISNTLSAVPALFFADRSHRGRLRLTGRDRQSFLQGMVSNEVARLAPGQGCYAFQLDATAHVLADMRVLCADDYLLLDVEPGLAPQVAATLERYLIMERCRITDVSANTFQVFVGGANAPAFLESVLQVTGSATWTEAQNVAFSFDSLTGTVAATQLVSGPGFDLYFTDGDALDLLTSRLAESGAVSVGGDFLDALRVEAGIPRFGVDLDARVLAPETGQASRAVSLHKGCYIGQEIVARIDARGHTNRAFAGFELEPGENLPAPETPVFAGEETREVGRITSAVMGLTTGKTLALGYLRQEFLTPGTRVRIGENIAATVAVLPFVSVAEAA